LYCFLTLILCRLLIFYAVGVTTIDASQKRILFSNCFSAGCLCFLRILLTVFVNASLATLFSLAVIIYSLHIGYSAWYNTSFGVIYMLCLIDVYCIQTNVSPQDTHTHVTFHVALERPKRPLATDSWFYGASPRLVSKRFSRAGANSWAHMYLLCMYECIVLIIRRDKLCQYNLCHSVPCAGRKFTSDLHTTRPSTKSDSYQRLY
jgi:hypothetical protein